MTAHPIPLFDRKTHTPAGSGPAASAILPSCDMIRQLERELQNKQRFTSDASHELGTVVAGLRTGLEEARMHPDETDLRVLLAKALRNVERLEAILTDLRVLAEMESGPPHQPQRVDLAGLVRDEIARRNDRIAAVLRLERGVTVTAVPIRISRMLTNLLDNAQRHARSRIEARVTRDGDMAELTVTDDGEGIAESEREHVFQRFARLKAARRLDHTGSGLGLAIARDIALAHLGSLHVEESETGGARFVLRLPLAELAPAGRHAGTTRNP
ncbi:HAMP domain-containing sensor histidine kinase [Nonomuraea sp. NPDC049709]|uniref:sensor histidine kinase n=1 Tax=Nonomuraea sp. NPDC049709 TaxID=3154736 RepID=UPI00342FD0D1